MILSTFFFFRVWQQCASVRDDYDTNSPFHWGAAGTFTICFHPAVTEAGRGRSQRRTDPLGATMAATDSGATPLQNAMKMAKVAIQLDGGSKHKVSERHSGSFAATRKFKPALCGVNTPERTDSCEAVYAAAVFTAWCFESKPIYGDVAVGTHSYALNGYFTVKRLNCISDILGWGMSACNDVIHMFLCCFLCLS